MRRRARGSRDLLELPRWRRSYKPDIRVGDLTCRQDRLASGAGTLSVEKLCLSGLRFCVVASTLR